jgi:hypothetical protein
LGSDFIVILIGSSLEIYSVSSIFYTHTNSMHIYFLQLVQRFKCSTHTRLLRSTKILYFSMKFKDRTRPTNRARQYKLTPSHFYQIPSKNKKIYFFVPETHNSIIIIYCLQRFSTHFLYKKPRQIFAPRSKILTHPPFQETSFLYSQNS